MTQIVPMSLHSARHRKRKIGYRVLQVNGVVYRPFTVENVHEGAPGDYMVSGGVACPDDGAYVIWSIAGAEDIATVSVEPAATPAIAALLDVLATQLVNQLAGMTESRLAPMLESLRESHRRLSSLAADQQILGLQKSIAGLIALVERLDGLEDASWQLQTVAQAAQHLEQSGMASLFRLIERLDSVKREHGRRMQTIAELDQLIEAMSNGQYEN